MRVFCIRTLFEGKECLFIKGRSYKCYEPSNYEKDNGVSMVVVSERKSCSVISKKSFAEHFIDIKDFRNNRIDDILNR